MSRWKSGISKIKDKRDDSTLPSPLYFPERKTKILFPNHFQISDDKFGFSLIT